MSSKAAPKRALGRAHKIGRALYAATPLPAVEQLIGAMANPSSGIRFVLGIARRGAQRVSEVQSVIFDKLKWALEDAKAWLRKHGFAVPKVDEGATYWRFRQQDPKKYMEFRTITPGEGSANPSGPRRWLAPYHRDKINYEDVGYLPLALEHDVGFAGDRIYRVVEQTPQGFRRVIDDVSPYRSRREALERLREIAAERGYLQSGPLANHTNPLSYEPVYHIEDRIRQNPPPRITPPTVEELEQRRLFIEEALRLGAVRRADTFRLPADSKLEQIYFKGGQALEEVPQSGGFVPSFRPVSDPADWIERVRSRGHVPVVPNPTRGESIASCQGHLETTTDAEDAPGLRVVYKRGEYYAYANGNYLWRHHDPKHLAEVLKREWGWDWDGSVDREVQEDEENPERNGFDDPTPTGWGVTMGRAHAGDVISGNRPGRYMRLSDAALYNLARYFFDHNKVQWGFQERDFSSFARAFKAGYRDRLEEHKREHPGWERWEPGKQNPAYSRVKGPHWMQEWYDSASNEARRRAAELRKLGYRVSVSNMGPQVTRVGTVRMTLVDIRPGTSGDDYLERVPGSEAAGAGLNPSPAYDVVMGPVSVQEWHVSDSKARGRAAELKKLGYHATLRKVRRVRTPDGIVDITVLTIRPGKTGDKYLEKVPGSKAAKWRPNPCQDDRESPESGPVQSTIPAPPEIRLPFSSVVDHGLVLVHELDGSPRNYLHEVSIKDQDYDAREYARDAGYHLSHGWVDQDGQQYWVYRKRYPLGVAEWREGKSAGADNPEYPDSRTIWERHKQLTEKIRKSHPEWSWDMVYGYVAGIETAEGISKDPSDPRLMEQIRHHYQDAIRTNDDYGWAYAHGLTERGKTLGLWSSSPEELFRKVLRNPLQKGADNPEPEAAALYEDFHGRPPSEVKEIVTEREEHEWLTQLGTLVELKLNTLTNLDASIKFSGADAPDLCSSEDGRQLYIEGGNQEVDLAALKMDGDEWRKDSMVLGVIKEITYRTEKHFHKFDPIDYYHKLGEETGELPYLVYDPNNKLLSISGGQYQVKPEGIVN